MNKKEFKIGFSEIGGIFIGKNIQSDFHQHYAITAIISLGESQFKITTEKGHTSQFRSVLIQKNVNYSLKSSVEDYIAFIHIVPFSPPGIQLTNEKLEIQRIDILKLEGVVKSIKDWFAAPENYDFKVEEILRKVPKALKCQHTPCEIDPRIMESFQYIMQHQQEKLSIKDVLKKVNLSESHFNRLFKKETGLTFRQFVLHSKLIKSIQAMNENNSLTQATFIGGFADQPHLTRTFKNNFGIKPSVSLK